MKRPVIFVAAVVAFAAAAIATPVAAGSPSAKGAGTWSATGSMKQAREGGGGGLGGFAAMLPDGRVLVAGGFTTDATHDVFTVVEEANYLATAEIYDPESGKWKATGSMHHSRFAPILVSLSSGKVLVAGGNGAAGKQDSVRRSAELYDPRTGKWKMIDPMTDCRAGASASVLKAGKILVAGGLGCQSASESQATAEIFDPKTSTWTAVASMNEARQGHSATVLPDGRVLVAGGRSAVGFAEQVLDSAEVYDPAADKWKEVARMSVGRLFHSAGLLSTGHVVVAGGKCPGESLVGVAGPASSCRTETSELFNPATEKWRKTDSMSVARLMAGSIVLPDKGNKPGAFLIAGGGQQASAEMYDPSSGKWSSIASMSRIRDDVQLVRLRNGDILVAGGFEMAPPFYRTTETAELYRPAR